MSVTVSGPFTLDGNPYETVEGIREDTSSRGVDLAGALIVATYADGTSENLTWAALDPYTFGGATGTHIDMEYGWSEHELTTTKLLSSLEINLVPANSVFDITTTMEDDLTGINTPTSKNGFPFELLTYDAGETGSVSATYSDIVNLAGRPADGDLFTTILIDFSGLTAGGILGYVTWNSDIDTLEIAGDLVPAPPPVTTNTVVDTNDDHAWAVFTDTFGADGVRVLREMTYDDGRQVDTTYTDGVRSSVLSTDPTDVRNWETLANTFDTDGLRTGETRIYDNGRVLTTDYEDGVQTQAAMSDGDDVYRWESYVDTFDANGIVTSREMIYDSGHQVDTTYTDGTRSSTFTTDLEDAFNWATIEIDYSANGDRTSQTNTYDNGRVLEVQFADGIRAQATMTDVQDAHGWESYVDIFDANGDRVSREMTFDNGNVEFTSYQDSFVFI